jgi:hypothetical protein
MPHHVDSRDAEAFTAALYEHGWVVDFDWPDWQKRAERYTLDPRKVAAARIGTIRKLLTTHVHKDRFCEGHLAAMFENGHLMAILQRLRDIWDSGSD